jgi:hypothetical protein
MEENRESEGERGGKERDEREGSSGGKRGRGWELGNRYEREF